MTRRGGDGAVESEDGKTIFYLRDGLWKVPTQGGEESQVLDFIYQACFAVGDKGIYFIPKADETGLYSIQFYSLATGKTTQIVSLPAFRKIN